MFDPEKLPLIRQQIRDQTKADNSLLTAVCDDVRALGGKVKTVQPRGTTSISLVASDGGNNKVEYNPFYLQLIRVVDSYGDELFLDVVSPSTDITELGHRHLPVGGQPQTALGRLMSDLGITSLSDLSPMLPPQPRSAGWTLVYRDLCEWATLYDLICYQRFSTDTLIVRDGLLRTKIFAGDLFVRMYHLITQSIERIERERHREVYLVGIAKHSQVLRQYQLAMAVTGVFDPGHPCFAPVPMAMQEKVYVWEEYIRNPDDDRPGEPAKFNMGSMYFVRFGTRTGDPIWTVDLLANQAGREQKIFGCLLADAVDGFPIPFYPNCLQQADHHAQIVDFDLDILQDTLVDAIRDQISADRRAAFDGHRLASDLTGRRYQ